MRRLHGLLRILYYIRCFHGTRSCQSTVAVTHVTQCEACTALHTRNAKLAGATDREIAEAVFVAMALRAGAAIGHFKTTAATLDRMND